MSNPDERDPFDVREHLYAAGVREFCGVDIRTCEDPQLLVECLTSLIKDYQHWQARYWEAMRKL